MVECHSSPSPAAHTGRPWRTWRTWLRLVLLASCMIALVGVAGCGTPSYNCMPPNGCFGGVTLSTASFGLAGTSLAGTLWHFENEMYVTPLACDATCRASTGDRNNPGGIFTVTKLASGQYYIAVGYGTDASGNQQFFVQTLLPESPLTRYWLGDTGDTRDRGPYYVRVDVLVYHYSSCYNLGLCPPPCTSSQMVWYAQIEFVDVPFSTLAAPGGCTAFAPDSVLLGQFLIGTTGANNSLGGKFLYTDFETNPYKFPMYNYPTTDGTVTTGGPPYVAWGIPPSKDSTGGYFWTECCSPPCDALVC